MMENPVPEVAFPYVCEYFQVMLRCLLHPSDSMAGAVHEYVAEVTGMPQAVAHVLSLYLYERGLLEYYVRRNIGHGASAWGQLTARGFLVALALQEQKGK